MDFKRICIALASGLAILQTPARGSGHGPLFSLATPTNPQGGWSFDTSFMGRYGAGSGEMLRGTLGYGVTEDLKLSISGPLILQPEPFVEARAAPFTPMGGDFEGLALWRFQRSDFGVGSRFETTAIGGLLIPGPQAESGPLKGIRSGPGALAGIVTGIASRRHYVWVGTSYHRYAASSGDRRPDLLFYSLAYAYRPPSWRKDQGWDWRIFTECTGERTSDLQRDASQVPGSNANQVFIGPSTLGVYKNYAVSFGVQFAAYQNLGPVYPRERVRVAVNFTRFF